MQRSFFWFFLDTESMTLTRNYANTQGQPDRARWCFYQQLKVRVRQITGKDHSSSLCSHSPPHIPELRWFKVNIPSFVCSYKKKIDILQGTVRWCANSAMRDRECYIPVDAFTYFNRLEDGQTSCSLDGCVQHKQVFNSSRTSWVVPQYQLVRNDLKY